MLNILFLGLLYDIKEEKNCLHNSRIGLQSAINTFQWNIIEGLEANINSNITIYNTLPVGTYPRQYKKLYLRSKKWSHKTNASDLEIGCLNFPVIKQLMRSKAYLKNIKKWIKSIEGEKYIISYSLYLPYINVLNKIKKDFPDVKIILIVPDLPSTFGILPMNPIKRLITKTYGNYVMDKLECFDAYILLTEQMKKPLNITNKPYVVIEGIVSENPLKIMDKTEKLDEKVILYTGTLKREFGIQDLLNTFKIMEDEDIQLWIAGSGELKDEILRISKEEPRIKFFGHITHNEVIHILSQSTLLVNPRNNQGEYTKYSFPSKTMEYMLSGKPVIMHKLDGIPNDYNEYLIYFSSNSPEVMAMEILELLNKESDELISIGQKARNFVISNKTARIQGSKIVSLLRAII